MDCYTLLLLASVVVTSSAWSAPFYTVHRPLRVTRYAPLPPLHRIPIPVRYERWQRPKRGQDEYDRGHIHPDHDRDRDHDHDDHDHKDSGVTGPVHTFVKTDKNANYKWGVRHHVGNKYKS